MFQRTFNFQQTLSATDAILELEVSLDVVSLEFGIHEILLARETGTILVFVVGLCRGRPNQLDWRTQLLCAKQSS